VTDPRVGRLADVVVQYSLGLQPGKLTTIESPALAEPLVLELTRAVLEAGAHPHVKLSVAGTDHAFMSEASDEQVARLTPWAVDEMTVVDSRIAVHADYNTRELSAIDPAKMRHRQESRAPVMERYMARSASGELTWCVTAYPCEAFAQDAGMSLGQYEDFVYRAGWLHLDDPVSAWRDFSAKLHAVTGQLADVREIRVLAEDTDVTVGVNGRKWIAADGDRNFPDGEVFTGPEENVTRGDVRFTFPVIFGGREVEDVRLRFEDGKVVRAEAGSGEGLLKEMLAVDAGASVLGEFAIGTNYNVEQFTKQILFDEKIGGTFHMAVGAGYPETGSTNVSALHWDMVCDLRRDSEIQADGEVIYRNGVFLPEFADDLRPPEPDAASVSLA
jgi:aminopeptidase